jgi:hypothetical protein
VQRKKPLDRVPRDFRQRRVRPPSRDEYRVHPAEL